MQARMADARTPASKSAMAPQLTSNLSPRPYDALRWGHAMEIKVLLRMAAEAGLILEPIELGYRVFEADGCLIGSQLPLDVVEALIRARSRRLFQQYDKAGLSGTAFPPS